jgi:hypothetical protein
LGYIIIAQNYFQIKADKEKDKVQKEDLDRRYLKLKNSYDSSVEVMKINYDSSVSFNKRNFDTSNNRTVLIVSQTLGKYGFQLDTTNRILKKMSVGETPIVELSALQNIKPISFLKNENHLNYFDYTISSSEESSSFFNLSMSMVIVDSTFGRKYAGKITPLIYSLKITKGGYFTSQFFVSDFLRFDSLYIWFRGTCKGVDEVKKGTSDLLYLYERNVNKTTTIISEAIKEEIEAIIKKSEN